MEQTPPGRVVRQRHTPTPKMSERKKKLFTSSKFKTNLPGTIDEDSDLGPMSPLQFSCSPSSYDTSHNNRATRSRESRTDFKDIMLQLSPMNSNKHQCDRTTPTKNNIQPKPSMSSNYERILDSPHSTKSSDMFPLEKENRIESAQKTPSTVAVTTKHDFPRISFRKSLIFDTGMTPDENYLSPKSKKIMQKRAAFNENVEDEDLPTTSHENPKARASLSFSEQPQISVKTFYGSSLESTPIRKRPIASISSYVNEKSNAKRKPKPKKSARRSGPTLGNINRGVKHKIVKPKTPTSATVGSKPITSMNRTRIIEAAIDILGNNKPGNAINTDQQGDQSITQEQIAKLQKILRRQRNSFELSSKPLNWTGSHPNVSSLSSADTSTLDMNNTTFGDVSEMNNSTMNASTSSCPDTDAREHDLDEQPKRKFFKSKESSTTNTYTVIKGMCATVKRGSGVTLLSPPKKKKRSDEYYELLALKEDVSNIIDMLISDDTDEHNPDPCQTTQYDELPSTIINNPQEEQTTEHNSNANHSDMQTEPSFGESFVRVYESDPTNEDLTTHLDYQRFADMLPYNTTDPEVQQRQETLLNLLYTNNICTEENFKIFIAEPSEHEEEAASILEDLFVLDVQEADVGMDSSDELVDVPMSPASQISTMTLSLALGSPKLDSNIENGQHMCGKTEASPADVDKTNKLFPVFEKNHAANAEPEKDVAKQLLAESKTTKLTKWKAIGSKQLQLDAGQKKFGGSMCSCGMFYSVHEPEDEELHQKYHDIYNQLQFNGWVEERVVCSVPEWGAGARIICVTDFDTKMKRNRCSEFVALVDRELGYADIPTKPQSIIYLAITKRQVIGICVAEPLKVAHALKTENGIEMMDLTTNCAVKCGISRLWVAGPHRRHGIAMRMFTALRSHFIRGYTMRLSEVAFSSPTELGRSFASRVTDTVLVY